MKRVSIIAAMVIIMLLLSNNIVIGGGQQISKKKAWANFEPLISKKETKRIYKLTEMDNTTKQYYNKCKVLADKQYPGKFEMYELSTSFGKVSIDTQYLAVVKTLSLSPRVDGNLIYSENVAWGYPVSDELSYIDAKGKVLWKKYYDWNQKADRGISIEKITAKGEAILVHLPDTSYPREEWTGFAVVYNKIGNEVYRHKTQGLVTHGPYMTDNGKFISIGVDQLTQGKGQIWTIYDLVKGDSVNVLRTTEGPLQVDDNGIISMTSRNAIGGIKWFKYDSLRAIQRRK